MRKLVVIAALVLLSPRALADTVSLSKSDELVRRTITAFYTHLLVNHASLECPPIFDGAEDVLSEMSAKLRASLGERDATAALWNYIRRYREALALPGYDPLHPPERLNIRYASWELGPPRDTRHIVLEVIGGANNTKDTGVRKHVGFALTWAEAQQEYRISPLALTVNGVIVLDPSGQFERPPDLWCLLGFKVRP